jgi:peptidyl-prolyl cis-trans isomerase D
VTDGDPSKLDAKTKQAARNTLAEAISTTTTREFVDALRADAKIRVSEERINEQQ